MLVLDFLQQNLNFIAMLIGYEFPQLDLRHLEHILDVEVVEQFVSERRNIQGEVQASDESCDSFDILFALDLHGLF